MMDIKHAIEKSMTRNEMLEFIKIPGMKISHALFDSSEYLYSCEDGNVYDENGYLFEDWYGVVADTK